MVKELPLTGGKVALVDDADFEFLNQWSWQANAKGYAVRAVHLGKIDGKHRKTSLKMHRLLAAAPPEFQVDHINGDKLDNRKSNLRLCTNSQNKQNGASYRNSTSKYRGVSWSTRMQKWAAQIQINKKKIMIGYYADEQDAARAYNAKATCLFGEFARLNQIELPETPPELGENN